MKSFSIHTQRHTKRPKCLGFGEITYPVQTITSHRYKTETSRETLPSYSLENPTFRKPAGVEGGKHPRNSRGTKNQQTTILDYILPYMLTVLCHFNWNVSNVLISNIFTTIESLQTWLYKHCVSAIYGGYSSSIQGMLFDFGVYWLLAVKASARYCGDADHLTGKFLFFVTI